MNLTHIWKIMTYEVSGLFRSKWLLFMGLFLAFFSEMLLYLEFDIIQVLLSLMNIIFLMIPLLCLVIGLNDFYHSKEYIELLLAQPIDRKSIWIGKVLGQVVSLCVVFTLSLGAPFLLNYSLLSGHVADVIRLIVINSVHIFIFMTLSTVIATCFDDRSKGLGIALLVWLALTLVYDILILIFIMLFNDYPFEPFLIWIMMFNPIDLGRILMLLNMEVSAIMGHTGAIFQDFIGSEIGRILPGLMLFGWMLIPFLLGIKVFKEKDF
jgi:Cu-processing system permease protein